MNIYIDTFETVMATQDFDKNRDCMSKGQHAREYRTLCMNFGRITGKSFFACELACEEPDTVIFTQNESMKKHLTTQLCERLYARKEGYRANEFRHSIMRRDSALSLCTGTARTAIQQARYIVFDECGAIGRQDFLMLAETANEDCIFIMLGDAMVI